jgi:predicted negative regulator of RcsB-dependent stress response
MRKKTIAALAIAVTLIIFAGSVRNTLQAQEGRGTGRLKGYVKGTDKEPLEGVKVTLEYIKYNYKLESLSDAKGKFVFQGLGPGNVKIWAQKDGYARTGLGFHVSGVKKNPVQHLVLRKLEEAAKDGKVDDQGDILRGQFKKADLLFDERKFEAALALYRDAQKAKPEIYQVGIKIGQCYLEMNRIDEAITEFKDVLEKSLAKNPNTAGNMEVAKLYSTIGDAYMRQDKLKEALEYFKKSIAIAPDDHALAYNVAEILFVAGKADEAIEYYDLAIKINPKWPKSYMQRGYAYLNKGDTKKAIESFNKYLELAPDSPEADGIREVIKSLK